jgi:hypothetical protein
MKPISRILIFAMLHLCWITSYGYADMVPTDSAVQSQDNRQRLLDLFDRQEVIEELEKYGISRVEAVARINSLTDEEVVETAGKLDELPEGGIFNLGSGCHRTTVNGRVVSESKGCHGPDAGAVLAVIGIIILVGLIYWLFFHNKNKAKVDSPSRKERPSSEPVVEEACDPGFESCI